MNNGIIPLDVWLGYFKNKEVTGEETIRNFISSECVRVEGLGLPKEGDEPEPPNVYTFLMGSELVNTINNVLNTDVPCWPEGLAEDFSNLQLNYEVMEKRFNFAITLYADDIEDKDYVSIVQDGKVEFKDKLTYLFTPKVAPQLDNQEPVFMELLTMDPEQAISIASGKALIGRLEENAPAFRVMKIDVEATPEWAFLESPVEMVEEVRVGIARYINTVATNLIHEDMVQKLRHVRIQSNQTGAIDILTSWEVFGQLYLITAEFVHDYQPTVKGADDEAN